jgi:hypothetical protein
MKRLGHHNFVDELNCILPVTVGSHNDAVATPVHFRGGVVEFQEN